MSHKKKKKKKKMNEKILADKIYQYCVKEKMTCHEFGLLATLINLRKESAYSTVRQHMDEQPLPSRD